MLHHIIADDMFSNNRQNVGADPEYFIGGGLPIICNAKLCWEEEGRGAWQALIHVDLFSYLPVQIVWTELHC